jgi:hypothetical protein
MSEPTIRYDEPSDTLYISFAPGEVATGIELNELLFSMYVPPSAVVSSRAFILFTS